MEGKRYRNRTTEICQIHAKDECRFAYGVQNLVALRSEKFEEGASVEYVTVRTSVEECVRRARECDGDVEVVRYYHGLYRALLEE